MSEWVVVSCDVCKRQTITEHPADMVVCETCLLRWDAEDEAAGIPVTLDDDDTGFDEEDTFL